MKILIIFYYETFKNQCRIFQSVSFHHQPRNVQGAKFFVEKRKQQSLISGVNLWIFRMGTKLPNVQFQMTVAWVEMTRIVRVKRGCKERSLFRISTWNAGWTAGWNGRRPLWSMQSFTTCDIRTFFIIANERTNWSIMVVLYFWKDAIGVRW